MALPVAAPVYGSVADLEQYATPQTSSRYAVIPGLGMFAWYPLASDTRNGTTVLGTGVIGRWKLSDTFGNGSVWKQPALVAADSNITLSGTQTIDGVSVASGSVVLATAQTTAANNGPWTCASGAWSRPSWFDSSSDAQAGSIFPVVSGATYGGSLWMITSPTSGTITPSTTAMVLAQVSGSGAIVSASLVVSIVMSQNQKIDASGTGSTLGKPLMLALDDTGHVDDTTTFVFVAAYTRSLLVISPDMNVVNADGTDFDPATWDKSADTYIRLERRFGRTIGELHQLSARITTAPRIVSAYADIDNADVVVVRFDRAVLVPATTGITITGSLARTVSSIKDATTSPEVRLQLDAALSGDLDAQTVHVAFGSTNTVIDLSGNALPAQSIGVFWYRLPNLVSSFKAGFEADDYVDSSGVWPEMTGNVLRILQQVTAGNRPALTANAHEGATGVRFDGVDNYLATADALSNYVSSTAKTIYLGAVIREASIDAAGGQAVNNDGLMGGGGTGCGFSVDKNGDGDSYQLLATNYGGINPYMEDASVGMQRGQPILARMRQVATTSLYARRDRFTESAATTTAATSAGMASGFLLGAQSGVDRFIYGDLFNAYFFNADLSANDSEGVLTYISQQSWAKHLQHGLDQLPPTRYAIVGAAMEVSWEQVMTVPTPAFNSPALSQYTFAVSGLPGSPTVNTTKLSFTPSSGDVGTHTATVTVTLGNRVVATGSFTVHVVAATGTGTVNVLWIGDSRIENLGTPKQFTDQLVAQGYTVTMLGSRGGRQITSINTGTDRLTITSHSLTVGEAVDFLLDLDGTGVLPAVVGAPLALGTTYYVKTVVDANTVELSRTNGGAILDFTGTGTASYYLRAADERNEGRGGWSWAHYAQGNHPSEGKGPFVNVDGEVDIAAYLAALPASPTIIIWSLNVNGVFGFGYNADGPTGFRSHIRSSQIAHAETLMGAFKRELPNVIQLIVAPPAPNLRQAAFESSYGSTYWRWEFKRGFDVEREEMLIRFRDRATDGIYLVSSSCIDPYNDFDSTDPVHENAASGAPKLGREVCAAVRKRIA